MDKFQNKYRIPSARAKWWNYSNNGLYFITICTAGHEHFFGEIVNDMELSAIGKIALQCWLDIPNHFPFVKLDAFVVMPNHVHGILEIVNITPPPTTKNKFGPQSRNLASIIRGYKIGVQKYATYNKIDFDWQARFHDHIIRNDAEFHRIHHYIVENPAKWKQDKFFNKGQNNDD